MKKYLHATIPMEEIVGAIQSVSGGKAQGPDGSITDVLSGT